MNVILKHEDRERDTAKILKDFGRSASDSVCRDAAELAAVRTRESMEKAQHEAERRYF